MSSSSQPYLTFHGFNVQVESTDDGGKGLSLMIECIDHEGETIRRGRKWLLSNQSYVELLDTLAQLGQPHTIASLNALLGIVETNTTEQETDNDNE